MKTTRIVALVLAGLLLVAGSVAAVGAFREGRDEGWKMDAYYGGECAGVNRHCGHAAESEDVVADGAVTLDRGPAVARGINPGLIETYEKLVNASPDLIAQGVPIVDFSWQVGAVDPDTRIVETIVIMVALREVKEEYKEPIKAMVEGVEGIEFYFFQARFTMEEIRNWQDDIVETFLSGKRLPPGVGEVPLSGTSSSWRHQRIRVTLHGEIKPEYIEVIRAVVGNEAPLNFHSQPGTPWRPRYFRELWTADAGMCKQAFERLVKQLFPEVDIMNMRLWEAEEFLASLTPEERAGLGRALLDYAVEQGVVTPEEREELHQEWIERREEFISFIW